MGEMKDKVQGKAREVKGKVTGDKSDQVKGKAQQVKGAIEGKLDDIKSSSRDDSRDPEERYSGEGI